MRRFQHEEREHHAQRESIKGRNAQMEAVLPEVGAFGERRGPLAGVGSGERGVRSRGVWSSGKTPSGENTTEESGIGGDRGW